MVTQLTPEQLSLIGTLPGEPVPMHDATGKVAGYFVTPTALDNLQKLRSLNHEADDSPDVPTEEANARIRQMAHDANQKRS